jgi:hypothetical protein
MSEVIPIRRKATRPPECERALALLIEAQGLLEGLVERGEVPEGSPPEATLWDLNSAIGMLSPDEDEVAHG